MGGELGILYVVGTPIGNLEDITLRALHTLKICDACLAEDTRHTKKLFSHYDIKTPMISCYRHNEKARVADVISRIQTGEHIALVSDAGMPGISDPGERIIREVITAGLPVEVIPGACAPIQALLLSGMRTDRFSFEGFLPRKGNKRNKRLRKIADDTNTVIVFEAPPRLGSLLRDIHKFCGDGKVAICRELTKTFEETIRGNVSDILADLDANRITLKGEMVVVIEGKSEKHIQGDDDD